MNEKSRKEDADMLIEKTEVLVVGGGQAGVAMCEHLGRAGIPHLVLELNPEARRVQA